MPAARHASRSSPNALAVSATIGVRARAALGLGGADAARGLEPVDAGHMHVHQHEIVGLAGARAPRARPRPRPRRWRNGRAVAEPAQQRAREQRVDLVVLGDQDREPWRRRAGGVIAGSGPPSASAPHRRHRRAKRAASEAARTGLTR